MSPTLRWIAPDWPAPPGIRALSTLRTGGVSTGLFGSLNLAAHVGDEEACVMSNRTRLKTELGLPAEPVWLNQVHGVKTIRADGSSEIQSADASWTACKGVVCAVMTADCLPILLCSTDGERIASVHAGWRGLLAGVIESAIEAMATTGVMAWLGPAIGPDAFEVGEEVRAAFIGRNPHFTPAFRQTGATTWLADIYELGRIVLLQAGVALIYGGGSCTFSQPDEFFSYRRDHETGRMASLIWRE